MPQPPDLPTIVCRPASVPVELDGDLRKPVWETAEWVALQRNDAGQASHDSTVSVLWDAQNLYVGFLFEDPDPIGTMTQRDDLLWNDGNVAEVFIDPEGQGRSFYEFEVNPLNTLLDLYFSHPRLPSDQAKRWDAIGIETAVKMTYDKDGRPTHWMVEMSIPWSNFHTAGQLPPIEGDVWRVNFFRYDTIAREPERQLELSSWSATLSKRFDVPERFGFMRFEKQKAQRPIDAR